MLGVDPNAKAGAECPAVEITCFLSPMGSADSPVLLLPNEKMVGAAVLAPACAAGCAEVEAWIPKEKAGFPVSPEVPSVVVAGFADELGAASGAASLWNEKTGAVAGAPSVAPTGALALDVALLPNLKADDPPEEETAVVVAEALVLESVAVLPNLKGVFPGSVALTVADAVPVIASLIFLPSFSSVEVAAADDFCVSVTAARDKASRAHSGTPSGTAETAFLALASGLVPFVVVLPGGFSSLSAVVVEPATLVPKHRLFRGVCTSSINRFSRSMRCLDGLKGSNGAVKGADVQ